MAKVIILILIIVSPNTLHHDQILPRSYPDIAIDLTLDMPPTPGGNRYNK